MIRKLKKRKLFILCCLTFLILTVVSFGLYKLNEGKIDIILDSKSYSYLPLEAKNYIKEVYEETGEVILTEKNKEDNKPYLNPDYVLYLKNGKVSKYGHIPQEYVVDHSYANDAFVQNQESTGTSANTSLSYYNLRDEGYITNIYDQGSEGLCWAFASSTSLESHLAIKSNKDTMVTFSEKQVDYATTYSDFAIDVNKNPYITSTSGVLGTKLNEGGNMIRYVNSTAVGISPVLCKGNCSNGINYNSDCSITEDNYWKYNYDFKGTLSPYEITNFENTQYSVEESLFFNPLTNDSETEVNALVNVLKNQIINNGSLYVAVGAYTNFSIEYTPTGSERVLNKNGKNVIYYIPFGWNLASGMNHAVSIIGWDDNYSHSVCLDKNNFEIRNYSSSNCIGGEKHTIKGAWIVQNSWGANSDTFIYLPYNSFGSSFSSISSVGDIDYDNSYRATSSSDRFDKGNTKEVLNKVKFFVATYNTTINVYYDSYDSEIIVTRSRINNSHTTLLSTVNAVYPGLYTVDVLDKNIIFDENISNIKFTYSSDYDDYRYFASIHTNNVDENDTFIDISNVSTIDENILDKCSLDDDKCNNLPQKLTFNDNNVIVVSGITRNLLSSDKLTFKILNSKKEDVTALFHIFRNFSVSNYINALISFNNKNVSLDKYTIEIYYENVKYDEIEWNLKKYRNELEGIGTELNPHLIKTTYDLNQIRNHTTSNRSISNVVFGYYELVNDLDLTYDTQEYNGQFYNSGLGWNPIDRFAGNFNGNNHVIKGLYINRPSDSEAVGLFGYGYGLDNYIKNLILKDVNVIGNSDVAALIGNIYESRNIDIHDIAVINGKIVSNGHTTSSIVGHFNITDDSSYSFYNLFNNASIGIKNSNFVGGILGSVASKSKWISETETWFYPEYDFTIKDTINLGKVYGNVKTGGIVANFSAVNELNLKNIISLGTYENKNEETLGDLFGTLYNNQELNINNVYYSNNMYGNSLELNGSNNISSNYKITFDDYLTNQAINKFEHSEDWIQPEIDGIKRIPMLKSMVNHFDFIEPVEDIELAVNSTINIFDLITPKIDAVKNMNFEFDENYLSISQSGKITPKKAGTTIIHINSLYDGYEDDVEVTIKDVKKVIYHANDGTSKTITQDVFAGEPFKLNKNTFSRKGYRFNLWCLDEENSGSICFNEEELMSLGTSTDLDLYANWSAINYGFKFDANGGYGSISTYYTRYPDSGKVILPDTSSIKKQHYVIDSWNTEPDGTGVKFSYDGTNFVGNIDDIIFDNSYHVTLYAQWKPAEYSVDYDSNGGTGSMNKQQVNYGDEIVLSKSLFLKDGYIFKDWNTEPDGSGITYNNNEKISVNSNIILYAQWTPIKYSISFYGNGNTGGSTLAQTNLNYGTEYKLRSNGYTKKGYTFVGWNTEANGSGKTFKNEEIIQNLTIFDDETIELYAIWKKTKYKVNYDLNGGTQNKKNATSFYITSKTFSLYEPTKKGYTFGGWYLNGTKTKITKVTSGTTKNIDIFASWTANRYNITYYGNGATSGTTTKQTKLKYGNKYNLSSNGFKKKGYTFVEWNTEADGTGKSFENKQEIKNLTSTNGKTVKLYAIWKKTKYKVNYDLNGGTQNKKNATSFYITSKTFSLYEPTKKGYTFGGWYLNGTKTKITKVTSGTTKNIDIFASWTANRYNITYYGNGATSGTTTKQTKLKYGNKYNLSSNGFKKKGYTFVEWNTEADGTGKSFKNKQEIKNLTSTNGKTVKLYAIWKKK